MAGLGSIRLVRERGGLILANEKECTLIASQIQDVLQGDGIIHKCLLSGRGTISAPPSDDVVGVFLTHNAHFVARFTAVFHRAFFSPTKVSLKKLLKQKLDTKDHSQLINLITTLEEYEDFSKFHSVVIEHIGPTKFHQMTSDILAFGEHPPWLLVLSATTKPLYLSAWKLGSRRAKKARTAIYRIREYAEDLLRVKQTP